MITYGSNDHAADETVNYIRNKGVTGEKYKIDQSDTRNSARNFLNSFSDSAFTSMVPDM